MDESTKLTIFGDSINHNQYYGLPSRFREPFNEIHRNICPNPCRDGKIFEQSGKEYHFTLLELACITFNHHMSNFLFHSLPKEVISFQSALPMEKNGVHGRQQVEDMCSRESPEDPCISKKNHPKSNVVQRKDYSSIVA